MLNLLGSFSVLCIIPRADVWHKINSQKAQPGQKRKKVIDICQNDWKLNSQLVKNRLLYWLPTLGYYYKYKVEIVELGFLK